MEEGDGMNARRTVIRLTFEGVDISADINRNLLSMTYTDNEEDKTDDLQLSLDDREGVWLGNWLNTPSASKGAEISAVIVQKNWESDGKDRVLDCGVFEIDTVDGSGPPAKATIKAGSIPYSSTIRTQKKTKAWENYTLSGIANEIAGTNGLTCMFESASNPFYPRKEQMQESDITFLQRLCKAAGISLKVTAKIIVLFDAADYEQKDAVRTIQIKLSNWGYFSGAIDGIYGPKTEEAVKYFQRKNGLTADGVVGPATLRALGMSTTGGESSASSQSNSVDLLARVISAEARGEPYSGQVAVGAVILNRVEHPSFPNTIAGVVYQPGAFTCMVDGQFNEPVADSAYRAARDALNGADPSGGAIYYFNPDTATSAWIWSRPLITVIGKHRFCS